MLAGVAAVLAGACIIGFSAILVKASDLGPQATAFWRLTLALPALALWLALHRHGKDTPPGRPDMRLMVLAGVFFAMDLAFWHVGIKITTAANATLLANLTPILVALFSWLLFRETVTRGFILVCAITVSGAALLAGGNLTIDPDRLTGDVFSILTAFWYAAFILTVRKARDGASTPRVIFLATLIAAPISLAIAIAFAEPLFPENWQGWIPLILLGVVVHAGGQGAIIFGLGRVPAPLAALILLVQPIVAAAAGWLLFDEALSAIQLLGAAIILAGLYLAQRTAPRPAASVPPAPE
ncbi:membrane protein [Glycocaulis albus]|uniref:Membrane protein n=1 Tax=Glycocaulis albus TaxID=1382801 RepID=A0ABQ1XZH8_9PROT|nr:DMT family transporter [Glycocaulis albus]GGH07959.1 membrane protein [Glycocaulis albus]